MWNDGGFGGSGMGGGGFINSPGQFGSPVPEVKRPQKQSNIVPVSIRMILECNDEVLKIGDTEVSMVSIIGLIKSVEVSSTKITYVVDDTTGLINAVHWVYSDEDTTNPIVLSDHIYCRVVGTLRSQQNERTLMVLSIVPIVDLNQMTSHILEVIHSKLKLKKLSEMGSTSAPGVSGMGMTSAFQAVGKTEMGSFMNGGNISGLNSQQQMVLKVIVAHPDQVGAHRTGICSSLNGKMNRVQIDNALEFLSSEGHIYTTIDDDTFKSTDS